MKIIFFLILLLGSTQYTYAQNLGDQSYLGDAIRIDKNIKALKKDGSTKEIESGSLVQIIGAQREQNCVLVTLSISINQYSKEIVRVKSDDIGVLITIMGIKPEVSVIDSGHGSYSCPI